MFFLHNPSAKDLPAGRLPPLIITFHVALLPPAPKPRLPSPVFCNAHFLTDGEALTPCVRGSVMQALGLHGFAGAWKCRCV